MYYKFYKFIYLLLFYIYTGLYRFLVYMNKYDLPTVEKIIEIKPINNGKLSSYYYNRIRDKYRTENSSSPSEVGSHIQLGVYMVLDYLAHNYVDWENSVEKKEE